MILLAALGRKMRIWERRLLRDFHVVSVAGGEDGDQDDDETGGENQPKETGADRFRKLASVAVAMNTAGLAQHLTGSAPTPGKGRTIKSLSQIGRSMSNESFKSSQNLRKAMEEAQRLTVVSPTPDASPNHNKYSSSPLPLLPDSGSSVLELLRSMSNEEHADMLKEEDEDDDIITTLTGNKSNQLATSKAASSLPWKHDKNSESSLSIPDPSNNTVQNKELGAKLRPFKKAPAPPTLPLTPINQQPDIQITKVESTSSENSIRYLNK